MMKKTVIEFRALSSNLTEHQKRTKSVKEIAKEIRKTKFRVCLIDMTIKEKRKQLERVVKDKTGQRIQKNVQPIMEAVVLLPTDDNTLNLKCLRNLTDELKNRYGIKAFQWHIHDNDNNETGIIKNKNHGHILFDFINHYTGEFIELYEEDMSNIISIASKYLDMDTLVKKLSLIKNKYE